MDAHSPGEPAPPQFTLRAMFVLMAVIAMLLGLLLPALNAAREESRRTRCQNDLKQIGLALHNYHDNHKAFPLGYTPGPDMSPWTSWRTAISAFVEKNSYCDQYRHDEPWNGRNNVQLENYPLFRCYQCPSDSASGLNTCYVAVVGSHTAWPAPKTARFRDFTKGTSNTILVSEMSESGIHWMGPRDLQFDEMEFKIYAPSRMQSSSGRGSRQAVSSAHRGGAQVVFADGSVDFLSVDTSNEVLMEMFLIGEGGGEVRNSTARSSRVDDQEVSEEWFIRLKRARMRRVAPTPVSSKLRQPDKGLHVPSVRSPAHS